MHRRRSSLTASLKEPIRICHGEGARISGSRRAGEGQTPKWRSRTRRRSPGQGLQEDAVQPPVRHRSCWIREEERPNSSEK
ncbi:hypothetical protein MUK42_17663 [Musa troglodytarum]|uniref:Uncharacterized protein n=1 Tax=Musa troglodytarum TaxID=320322 RepID=A0A9E7HJW9_9LILI|nr:hypothetical protein MUK42_17663 [Musa troglodytarum]